MKDYDRSVIWTDYFDSDLSRSSGRRVPLNSAIRHPSLEELAEAVRRLGYDAEPVTASYPKHSPVKSGYVSFPRTRSKAKVIKEIAEMLARVRGERKQSA